MSEVMTQHKHVWKLELEFRLESNKHLSLEVKFALIPTYNTVNLKFCSSAQLTKSCYIRVCTIHGVTDHNNNKNNTLANYHNH